jgi:hypothetical protein
MAGTSLRAGFVTSAAEWGLSITRRHSKTDQEGERKGRAIPFGRDAESCPAGFASTIEPDATAISVVSVRSILKQPAKAAV